MNRPALIVGTALVALAATFFLVQNRIMNVTATINRSDARPHVGTSATADSSSPRLIQIIKDYKCPNCRTFELEHLDEIIDLAQRSGFAIEFIDYPFLSERFKLPVNDSHEASMAAMCTYSVKGFPAYREFSHQLYQQQAEESEVWAEQSLFRKIAPDFAATMASCDKQAVRRTIASNIDAVKASGVIGVPAVLVNGKRVKPTASSVAQTVQGILNAETKL